MSDVKFEFSLPFSPCQSLLLSLNVYSSSFIRTKVYSEKLMPRESIFFATKTSNVSADVAASFDPLNP